MMQCSLSFKRIRQDYSCYWKCLQGMLFSEKASCQYEGITGCVFVVYMWKLLEAYTKTSNRGDLGE